MFENKKILILGMARSGYEAAKILVKKNNKVILNDLGKEEKQNSEQVKELRDLGVELIFGSHPDDLLDTSFNYLIKNPGIAIDHKYVLRAKELGIEVINEVEMTYRLLPKDVTLVGITGTNGKTTTTSLIGQILRAYFDSSFVVGNIGIPYTKMVTKTRNNSVTVAEISSFQL